MANMIVNGEAKEAVIELTVIRADGRVEPLGTVAYWSKNPFKRWTWKLKQLLSKGLN